MEVPIGSEGKQQQLPTSAVEAALAAGPLTLSSAPAPVVCQNSIVTLDGGRHGSESGCNVPRTRSVGCRARSAQDPRRPCAREPRAPTATRPAPPPLEATTVQSPRSRLLGVALAAVGTVARGVARRTP